MSMNQQFCLPMFNVQMSHELCPFGLMTWRQSCTAEAAVLNGAALTPICFSRTL